VKLKLKLDEHTQ